MIVNPTKELRAQYKLVQDSYTGQGGFSNGSYIFPYKREMDYDERKAMAEYGNVIKPIVDAKVDPVFAGNISREYDSELLDVFLKDSNNNGVSLEQMVHHATTGTVLDGNSFLVMDNFPESEVPDSYGEVIATRKMPYIYSKSVLDVFEYETDLFGKLQRITFYYGVHDIVDSDEIYLYKRFTDDEIVYFIRKQEDNGNKEKEWVEEVISITKNDLGVVPVVYYDKEVLPFSPYYSMATLARKVYNIDSELGDLERSQMFSILLIPSTFNGHEPQDNLIISTSNALFFDAQATNTPDFIAPDSNIMKVQMEHRQNSVDNLIQTADILGTTAIGNSNSTASGIAERYKFFGKQQALQVSSKIATYYDEKVIELLGLFMGIEFEYNVDYPSSFTPSFSDTQQKIDALIKIGDLDISDNMTAQVNIDIIRLVGEFMGWDDERINIAKESVVEVEQVV